MKSEKDTILESALEIILTERIEGQVIDRDYTGYWDLLIDNLFKTSLNTFINGIVNFYDVIKANKDKKELNTYHHKFMMRCLNSENIMAAANNLYLTLKENLKNKHNNITYDMFVSNEIIQMENIEKVLLFLYIYEDRIAIGVQDYLSKNSFVKNKK